MNLGLLPHRGESITSMQKTGQANRFLSYYLSHYVKNFENVYYFSYADEQPKLPDGCTLLPKKYNLRSVIYTFLMPFAWSDYFRRCDVVRVFQTPGVFPAAQAKLRYGVPFAITYGYHYDKFAWLNKSWTEYWYAQLTRQVAFCMADAIIVTNQELYQHVSLQVPPSRLHFIPNGVDTEVFCPAHNKPPHDPTVIFVGSLVPRKNLTALVKAVSLIPFHVRLLFIGEGPERGRLAELARTLGVDLLMPGILPHHEVASALQQADIFVLCSHAEGHPKALIEAMSCGLPVIATPVTGVSSLVKDGVTGLLCSADPPRIAQMILEILRNSGLASRLSLAARRFICDCYDIHHFVEKEINLLKCLARNYRERHE